MAEDVEVIQSAGIRDALTLTGLKARQGSSMQIRHFRTALSATVGAIVLPSNPARVWAVITLAAETSTGVAVFFNFGSDAYKISWLASGEPIALMRQGDNILLNEHLPWAGDVRAYTSGAGAYVTVLEAEIQPEARG